MTKKKAVDEFIKHLLCCWELSLVLHEAKLNEIPPIAYCYFMWQRNPKVNFPSSSPFPKVHRLDVRLTHVLPEPFINYKFKSWSEIYY